MINRLAGKTALVTGAGSGIGRQVATRFVAEGARVVFSDRNVDAAAEAAGDTGGTLAVEMDISNEDSVRVGFADAGAAGVHTRRRGGQRGWQLFGQDGAMRRLPRGLPVVRLGVFDPRSHISTAALWRALRESARRDGFAGQLVGGMRTHFTELNRQIQHIPADVPALTFSVTPQMHASEIPHIVDSLAMQRVVAENALRLVEGCPVLVGPITSARRFNAVATTAPPGPAVDALRAIDPLQATTFAGAWTLGSVAALTTAGVTGVCYYETRGPRGIITAEGALTRAGDVLTTPRPASRSTSRPSVEGQSTCRRSQSRARTDPSTCSSGTCPPRARTSQWKVRTHGRQRSTWTDGR